MKTNRRNYIKAVGIIGTRLAIGATACAGNTVKVTTGIKSITNS